jgi:hypothetical protein
MVKRNCLSSRARAQPPTRASEKWVALRVRAEQHLERALSFTRGGSPPRATRASSRTMGSARSSTAGGPSEGRAGAVRRGGRTAFEDLDGR